MRIAILGFVLLAAGVARASAAFYFVDYVGGSDANEGTDRGRAWKHCPGDPAAVGVAAAVALVPGDTVHFKGGVEYVFSAATGIRLDWDGGEGARITYDGNSDGSWGVGRAILTDHRGAGAITAFSTLAARHHLTLRSFEFYALGGADGLPPDTGVAVPARFGGGIAFLGGADAVVIEDCAFRELGYWQNQRPLAAESLAGAGIRASGSVRMTVNRCTFSRMAKGYDLSGANGFSQVKLDQCVFGEALVWPLHLPPNFGTASVLTLDATTSTFWEPSVFYGSGWTGHGRGPFTTEVTVAYGEKVVFSASALSSTAASFQWLKDGVFLSGVGGSRLDLGTAEASDAGTYSAVATNAGGAASSNAIVLVVTGAPASPPPSGGSSGGTTMPPAEVAVAPSITEQPVSRSVTTGSTVSFAVLASGKPAPSYQWEKNGVPLAGATGAVLTLQAVTVNDAAIYRVVVGNTAGSVTSTAATLTVTEPAPVAVAPAITRQPASLFATTGNTVTFTVVATGTPAPSYQWEKNGMPLAGATTATLTLPWVTANDAVSYRVVVSNTAGSVTSAAATLTVTEPAPVVVAPAITQQPVSLRVELGAAATFSVTATGTPAPSYRWEKNGVPIAGATGAVLTLPAVTLDDAASYRVVVTTMAGSVTSAVTSASAVLTVIGPPAPPASSPPLFMATYTIKDAYDRAAAVFTVPGDSARLVLIRALGPTYAALGGAGAIADPKFDVYRGSSAPVLSNDNWGGSPEVSLALTQAGAAPFVSPASADAGLVVTLSPGQQYVVVSGVNGSIGNVLLEVYLLP